MNKRKLIIDAASILLGNILLAFAIAYFIIPNNVLSGGVAGLSIALSPLLKIEVDTLITSIIVISFILGYVFLGKEFALKTIASSILYPVLLKFMGFFELVLYLEQDPVQVVWIFHPLSYKNTPKLKPILGLWLWMV